MNKKDNKIRQKIFILLILIFIFLAVFMGKFKLTVIANSENTEVYVSNEGSDSNNGTKEKPYLTIKKAIEKIENSGTVYILNDLPLEYIEIKGKNITIKSAENNTTYTIKRNFVDGTYDRSIIVSEQGELNLENITLDGHKDDTNYYLWNPMIKVENGGILNIKQGTTIQNVYSMQNGAVSLNNATLNMTGGIIKDNDSTIRGGGVYAENNSTIKISGNSAISGNSSTWENPKPDGKPDGDVNQARGGGINITGGILEISESATINNNSCFMYGGGIYSDNCNITISGGTICNNKSFKGGAIYAENNCIVDINGGTINNNIAEQNMEAPRS